VTRTLSIVLPLFDAAHFLPRVLPPLLAAVERGEALEVLVVDDGSTDGGPDVCRRHGLSVLASGGRLGPGAARNAGARAARGDVVLFVDSDVVVFPDVPRRALEALARPGCVAVFGSYDDRPAARGLVSRYVNLRHHWVHQQGAEDAVTFWAGCGAVVRGAFLAAGGFDAARYPRPSIEDIELGARLVARGGRIVLDKGMLCTHLKRWTFRSMLATDLLRRAVPWTRLLLAGRGAPSLNVTRAERGKALLAVGLSLALLGGLVLPALFWVAGALFACAVLANRRFFAFLGRRGGPPEALAGVLLHQVYYHVGMLGYLLGLVGHVSRRRAVETR
jgi:GT2 family glycosyltransferase